MKAAYTRRIGHRSSTFDSTVLLLAACTASLACTGGTREVSEVRSLIEALPLERVVADMANRAPVQDVGVADEAVVVLFDEPLLFERLDLPRDLRLTFELGGIRSNVGETLRVMLTIRALFVGGGDERLESTLKIGELPEGETLRVDRELSFAQRVSALEITLARPAKRKQNRSGGAVMLRPQVHYRRTLPTQPPEPRRQVLFVTLDTLRADHLGCYGNEEIRTPNLDALARAGVRFEDAVSASNVTNPSHSSMFSGLYVKDHGVKSNKHRFDSAIPNLPGVLADEGFRTAGFGAASLLGAQGANLGRLFQEFDGCATYHQRRAEDVNADVVPWLNAHADEDFFAWVHYFDAHSPYVPPAPWNEMYDLPPSDERIARRDVREHPWFQVSDDPQYFRSQYMGEVSYLDHQLGVLTDQLRELGIFEDVLIVVVADHGESLGEHGIHLSHHGLYDETVRVPLIVKPPGRTSASSGGVVTGAVSTVDLFPTVLELLGIESDVRVRGRSLVGPIEAALASNDPAEAGASLAFVEHAHRQQVAIRTARHKLILALVDREYYPTYVIRAGDAELYDRIRDPREQENVFEAEQREASALRTVLDEFLSESFGHEAEEITDRDYIEQLRVLGYAE